jgi:PAS domain-containing protein
MNGLRQKNLLLILAREFSSKLATPAFIADEEGNLVFYNEPAEAILGQTFAEAGEMPAEEWGSLFSVERLDGGPMPLEEMPAGLALREHRPAHDTFWITGLDTVRRRISVSAFPLFEQHGDFVGVVAFFWEQPQ